MSRQTPRTSEPIKSQGRLLLALIGLWLAKLAVGLAVPISTDEAYYRLWGETPAAGYFDHPPMIAVWTAVQGVFALPALDLRWTGFLSAAVMMVLTYALYRRSTQAYEDRALQTDTMLLCWASLAGIAYGIVMTPDVPLLLFWTFALYSGNLALQDGKERWWIAAGLATGLGILSKYTMLLVGLVFLWGLVRRNPRQFRSPFPYLGGLVALIVLLPNLLWNFEHDWLTWRFQLRHGISAKRSEMVVTSTPRAESAPSFSEAFAISVPLLNAEYKPKEPSAFDALKKTQPLRAVLSFFDYVGGSLLLLGCAGIVLAWGLLRAFFSKVVRAKYDLTSDPFRQAGPLLLPAAIIPLGVFALFSLTGKIEANWAALALVSGAPYLALAFRSLRGTLHWALILNCILILLMALQSKFKLLPLPGAWDRINKETAGFAGLAAELERAEGPIFVDTYQLASMLHLHAPRLAAKQWPGITRDSEFVSNPRLAPSFEDYQQLARIDLVTQTLPLPHLQDFVPKSIERIALCWDGEKEFMAINSEAKPCPKVLRKVYHGIYSRVPEQP